MSILTIKIDNKIDVSLVDLTTSLLNIGAQYNRFLERQGIYDEKNKNPLIIRKLVSGSIIVELASSIMPIINDANAVFAFAKYFKESIEFFLGRCKNSPTEYDKKDLEQYNNALGVTADFAGSTFTMSADNGSNQTINFTINCTEANAAQNEIKKQIEQLKELPKTIYKKQLLTWYQVRFDNKSKDGNRGIIENIYPNPIKVIFSSDNIKENIINTSGFAKPWQELAYIIDVEVLFYKLKPKIYNILNFYPEETFDLEDDVDIEERC